MELVGLISSLKESWGQVVGVINKGDWDNIILIGNDSGKKLTIEKDFEFINVNSIGIMDLKDEINKKLKGKIKGTEVALTIASGTGKEHMALISALLSLPVGIRFTALTKEGIVIF